MAERQRRQGVSADASRQLFDEYAIDRMYVALTNVPDPDAVLRAAGLSRASLRNLEADDEITAALETRCDGLLTTPWRLESKNTEARDFVWKQLEKWMDQLLRSAWHAVPYGYSVSEVVYAQLDGGRIGLASICEKPLEWFQPRTDGSLIYMGQSSATPLGYGAPLDTDFKFLLTRRNHTYQQPYGEALLSRLYWAWYFRHNAWRFWMQFLERFGDPLILGQTIKPADFVKAVQGMGINSVIGVDRDDKVQAVTQAVPGEFERIEKALSQRIQKTILGQTLTTDVGDRGSFAAAQVHNTVRDDKRISDMRLVQPTVQRLVNALWTLNRFIGEPATFILADGRGLEADRSERDARLVQANVLQLTEKYLLRTYDYEAGDFVLPAPKPVTQPAPAVAQAAETQPALTDEALALVEQVASGQLTRPAGARLLRAALPQLSAAEAEEIIGGVQLRQAAAPSTKFTPDQQAVEELADHALTLAGQPLDPAQVRAAIQAATDPDDLRERLGLVLAGASREEFNAVLERALFAADVLGYVTASIEAGEPAAHEEPAEVSEGDVRRAELALTEKLVQQLDKLP